MSTSFAKYVTCILLDPDETPRTKNVWVAGESCLIVTR
jgi:hypothetical protein